MSRIGRVSAVRKLLFLTGAVVFVDTLFFAALTPLLPHYAQSLGLGKTGAGVLSAAYPAGAFLGAIPSGLVAGRLGVKPTTIVGLALVGTCMVIGDGVLTPALSGASRQISPS